MPTGSPPPHAGVVRLDAQQIDGGLWTRSGYHLTADQFTWSIPTAASSWAGYAADSEPFTGFVGFTTAQATQFAKAIALWDSYIAPNFTQTDDVANPGTIRAAFSHQGTDDGFAAYTFTSNRPTSQNPLASDIWFNADIVDPTTETFSEGTYGFETMLHELGHALGLKHSFEDPVIPAEYDNNLYSVMSYNDIPFYQVTFQSAANGGIRAIKTPVAPSTPMVLDIKAIQDLYGADPTTRTGNDRYQPMLDPRQPARIETIYDAGGSDSIDLTYVSRDSFVDLRPGSYSTIGYFSIEDQVAYWTGIVGSWATNFIRTQLESDTYTNVNNLGIAFGTVIETLYSGSGNDVLIGNDAANALWGGAGDDVITGGAGADVLNGDDGRDVFRDTAAGLDGDIIQRITREDVVNVTDLVPGGFSYTFDRVFVGTYDHVLALSTGQRINMGSIYTDVIVARADPAGGVDFVLYPFEGARSDFNKDGASDLLWVNAGGALSTWQITGTTALQAQQNAFFTAGPPADWRAQATIDWNGDGATDLLWRNVQDGRIAVWQGNGSGGLTQGGYVSGPVDGGWSIAGIGDVVGDSTSEILWRNVSGAVTLWLPLSAGYSAGSFYAAVDRSWHVQAVGDVNGDGRADIVWRSDSGALTTWNGNSNATFTAASLIEQVDRSWHVALVDDFTGDKRADILWRNDNGALSLWTSTGSGFAQNSWSDASVGSSWHIVASGDYNRDSAADILWREAGGAFSIWEGTTASSFIQGAYTDSSVGTNWSIVAPHYDLI